MSSKVIVVGSSHAGANVAYSLRRDGFDGQIDLFTTETFLPYHRPPLSKDFLKDKVEAPFGEIPCLWLSQERVVTPSNLKSKLYISFIDGNF